MKQGKKHFNETTAFQKDTGKERENRENKSEKIETIFFVLQLVLRFAFAFILGVLFSFSLRVL